MLVKWKDWEGPSTWVSLDGNQELRQFIERNKGNPLSCHLHRRNLDSNKIDCRNNPDGALGIQSRTTVRVPFSCASFNKYFRSLKETLPTDNGNVDFYLTGNELPEAIL